MYWFNISFAIKSPICLAASYLVVIAPPPINDFIYDNLHDPSAGALPLEINDVDDDMILAFENRYVLPTGTVGIAADTAAPTAAGAPGGGGGIVPLRGADNTLKRIPYELFEKLI